MVRRRRRKWGWGEEGAEAQEDPRIAVGKQQGKLERLLLTATKKEKRKSRSSSSRSNKTSLLNRIQSAHTKKTERLAGGKSGFLEVIHKKRKSSLSPFLPRPQPSRLGQSMN